MQGASTSTLAEMRVGWVGVRSLHHYSAFCMQEKMPLLSRWLKESCAPTGVCLGTKPEAGHQPFVLFPWHLGTLLWLARLVMVPVWHGLLEVHEPCCSLLQQYHSLVLSADFSSLLIGVNQSVLVLSSVSPRFSSS